MRPDDSTKPSRFAGRLDPGAGRKRQSLAANVAMILAILAWPLTCYGLVSQLGDYHPDTPRAIVEANQRVSAAVLCGGFLCLLGSLWLSGYSFTDARTRSVVAAVVCAGLVAFGVVGMWAG